MAAKASPLLRELQRTVTEPAPSRGCYDRALTRPQRHAIQRERLLRATARAYVVSNERLTISDVVRLAGVGRNTFYEYFDTVEHALAAVQSRVLDQLGSQGELALSQARTPVLKLKATVATWFGCLEHDGADFAVALRTPKERGLPLSSAGMKLATLLGATAFASHQTYQVADVEVRQLAAVGTLECLARAVLGGRLELERAKQIGTQLFVRMLH